MTSLISNFFVYIQRFISRFFNPNTSFAIVLFFFHFASSFTAGAINLYVFSMLGNAYMHAINGNIDRASINEILYSTPFSAVNARRLVRTLCNPCTEFEHLKLFRNFDLIIHSYKIHVSLTSSEPMTSMQEWMRFIDFVFLILEDYCSSTHYKANYRSVTSTAKPLIFRMQQAWSDYLLSNSGMHSTNGNVFIDHELIEDIKTMAFTPDHIYLLLWIYIGVEPTDNITEIAMSQCLIAWEETIEDLDDEGIAYDLPYLFDYAVIRLANRMNSATDVNFAFRELLQSLAVNLVNGWQDHLLTNSGMHATNGNGTAPQMRFPGFPLDINVAPNDELSIAMENLSEVINNGLDVNVNHTIDTESTDKLNAVLNSVTEAVSKTQLNATIGFDVNGLLDIGSIVLLISSSINYYQRPTKFNSYIFGASIVFAISKHGAFEIDLSRFIRSGTTPQIDTSDISSITTAIATLLCSYSCVNSPSEHLVSNIMRSLSSFSKHTESLEKILKWSITALETCVNYIRRHVFGTTSLSFFDTGRSELDDLLARVRSLDDQIHLNQFFYNVENSHLVQELFRDANRILIKLPRDKQSQGLCVALNNAITFLSKLKNKLDSMNLNLDGIRQEPCSLLMRGPPGMGKSQAMEHICHRMLPDLVPADKVEQCKKTPGHFIYNRQAENVYWEGFDYEKVICQFDDIGQARDIQGNPDNEIMNVIRAINIFQYNVHMAGIELKGNVKFMSKMVVANTNMVTFEFNSIISPDAFFRRFDLIVDVVPKPEFCTTESRDKDLWHRKLDHSKLPIGVLGITSMHPDMLEFHRFDYFNRSYVGAPMTYEQVVESMIKLHRIKATRFNQYQIELVKSRNTPQVDWNKFRFTSKSKFNDPNLDKDVREYLQKFTKNPDFLHNSMMICSWYHKHTKCDHKIDYIIASYLKLNPEFYDSCNWTFEQFAEFLINPDNDIPIPSFPADEPTTCSFASFYREAQAFYSNCEDYIRENYPKLQNLAKILVPLAAIATSVGAAYSIYSHFFAERTTEARSEYNSRSKPVVKFQRPPSMRHAQNMLHTQPQAMLSHDKSNIEIINKVVARNVYEIILPNNTERCGFAAFIRGNVFMVNRHFVTLCIANAEEDPNFIKEIFHLRKPNTDITYNIPVSCLFDFKVTDLLDDQDVAFILAPKYIPQHTDIVKYFVPRSEAHKYRDLIFRLIINNHNDYQSWVGQAQPVDSIAIDDTASPYVIRKGYRYMATTRAGDCGSLFTLCSSHSNARKIMGIHAAGNPNGFAFSTAIFEEDLVEVLGMFEAQVMVDLEGDNFPQCVLPFTNKHVAPLYKHNLRVRRPTKSSYSKSVLYGLVTKVTTAVAVTTPFFENGKLIDPLDIALDKYCKNKKNINPFHAIHICDQMYDDLVRNSAIVPDKRILTFEEAILGIENDDIFGSISRTTSPGFPYTQLPSNKGKGKTHWFGNGQEYDLDNPNCMKLKEDCLRVLDDAIHGIRHEHIFADNPKDETLPIEKVEANKVRLFNACPLVLLIVTRMLFGSFTRWYVANKIYNGSAIGVNCYSVDWELIRKELDKFGSHDNKGAGDYKSFDGSESSAVHVHLLDVIQKYYGDDGFARARFVIFLELMNSKHINGNLVYEWSSSLPSGHPLTTVINNLYNHFCFRYCWLASHDFDISCLPSFNDHVYLIVLGDDNLFSVSIDKMPVFNMLSIEKHMAEIGMTYTSDDKKSTIGDMKNLTEVTFLKRSFRFCNITRRYVAPLSLTSITEMLNWVGGADPNTTVESNVDIAYRELSLHGLPVYKVFTDKISKACQMQGVRLPITTSHLQNVLRVSKLEHMY